MEHTLSIFEFFYGHNFTSFLKQKSLNEINVSLYFEGVHTFCLHFRTTPYAPTEADVV